MKISAGSVDHDQLGGVSTDDHHAIQHAIDSGASHTGDITNTQHGTISQSNAHAHANLSSVTTDQHHAQAHTLASHSSEAHSELSSVGANDHHAQTHSHASHSSVGANDHHAQSHSVASHSDTTATGAELETLTNGSGSVTLHTHGTIPTEASKANMEAEATGTLYVPSDLVRNSPGVAKVWCVIRDSGALASPSYNVASVTDTGTGDRTITFDTDFSGVDYACVGAVMADSSNIKFPYYESFAAGSCQHTLRNDAGNPADEKTGTAIYGDQ